MIRPFTATDELYVLAIWSAYVQKYHLFLSDEWMAETRHLMASSYLEASQIHVCEVDGRIVGFIGMIGCEVGLIFIEGTRVCKGTI